MLTPEQWMNQSVGQGINVDGWYGNQCWDWAQKYNSEYIGAPYMQGNAINCKDTASKAFYDWIDNTPWNFPIEGDMIIWRISTYGHIAVCSYTANIKSFISYDQNWPSQGYYDGNGNFIGTGVVHRQPHDYNNVIGWLRPKNRFWVATPPPPPSPPVVVPPIVEPPVVTPPPEVPIPETPVEPPETPPTEPPKPPTIPAVLDDHGTLGKWIIRIINWLLKQLSKLKRK